MVHTLAQDDVIAAAVNLVPHIEAARDELEARRHVPSSLAKEMTDAGLFQLHLPRTVGGPEHPPLTAFRVVEELSKVDGSVGWCAMIAGSGSLLAGWLRPEVARDLFGQPPDLRMAGSIRPEGRAYPTDGGYRVQGQ